MQRYQLFIGPALLLLAVLLVYSNHFDNDFHFDDSHTIVNNVYIRDLSNIPAFFTDASTFSSLPSNQSYRPVLSSSLALDHFLGGGLKRTWFHGTSFLLFCLQGVLMYFFFRRLLRLSGWNNSFAGQLSLVAVAWYLLHPVQAETVNYLIARGEILSTVFLLAALLVWPADQNWKRIIVSLILVSVGALSKIPAVLFAPLLLLFLWMFREGKGSLFRVLSFRQLSVVWPAWAVGVALYLFIRKMEPNWVPGGESAWNYLITQPWVILHYFISLFFPFSLNADTDMVTLDSVWDWRFISGILFILVLILAALRLSRVRELRPASFGIFWFLLTLLPTSSFIPLSEVMNDHRMYLPFVGLILAVVVLAGYLYNSYLKNQYASGDVMLSGVETMESSKRSLFDSTQNDPKTIFEIAFGSRSLWTYVVITLILLAFGYGTYQRNNVWDTDQSLWKDVTEKSPKNARGLMNYGLSLMKTGEIAQAENYFKKGLALWPHYPYLHINMAIAQFAQQRVDSAEIHFRKALELAPALPEAYYYYAASLTNLGREEEAIGLLQQCLKLAPAHAEARQLLMLLYYNRSEFDKLKSLAEETLNILPDDPQTLQMLQLAGEGKSKIMVLQEQLAAQPTPEGYLSLSLEFHKAGKFIECIEAAHKALVLKPDYSLAWNNICSAYNQLGEWDKAIEAGEKAVSLDPHSQLAKNNLEWALLNKARQH